MSTCTRNVHQIFFSHHITPYCLYNDVKLSLNNNKKKRHPCLPFINIIFVNDTHML